MLGFERNLTHLDGHVVPLKRTAVTQPGTRRLFTSVYMIDLLWSVPVGYVETIRGEGMPIHGESTYGDLYVEYKVILPTTLSPEMQKSKPPT